MPEIIVAALYKFTPLSDCPALKADLLSLCDSAGLKGSLLVAPEGINGTVAGSRAAINVLRDWLEHEPRFAGLEFKESTAEQMPFYRMKVLLKKEIVSIGDEQADPNKQVGTYVPAQEWNQLLQDPELLVLDVRNDYETRVGTFKGAVDPKLKNFRDFPAYARENLDPKQHKKVAMFCTGGIRCEKSTALLLAQGFTEVYHLQGGILRYLEQVPEKESTWEGECFVFDQRVAVGQGLKPGTHRLCFGCRNPLSAADRTSPQYIEGVCCPYCHQQKDKRKQAGAAERHRQMDLAAAQGRTHIGPQPQKPKNQRG